MQLEDFLRSERPLDGKDIITIVVFLALLPLVLLCCGFFCSGLVAKNEKECPHCTQRISMCLQGRLRLKLDAVRDWSKDDLPWRYQLRMDIASALGIRVAMVSIGPLVKGSIVTEVQLLPWSAVKRMYVRRRDGNGGYYELLEDPRLEEEVKKDEQAFARRSPSDKQQAPASGLVENAEGEQGLVDKTKGEHGLVDKTQGKQVQAGSDGSEPTSPTSKLSLIKRVGMWRHTGTHEASDAHDEAVGVGVVAKRRTVLVDEAHDGYQQEAWKTWTADEMVAALCRQFKDPDSPLMSSGV